MGFRRTLNLPAFRVSGHSPRPRAARSRTALALLAGLLVPGATASAQAPPCAVWVVRDALVTREAWERARSAVEAAGCRRIYLQVSGRWDAYFPSAVFPPPANPPRGAGWADDPFGHALADAHARGIEVQAWVNAMLAWSAEELPADPAHVFRARPDWFVVGPGGRSMRGLSRADLDRSGLVGEGWFLDPARAEVRTELRRFVLEVATRYPVDGIHLDYIRYPTGWRPAGGDAALTYLVGLLRQDLSAVRPGLALSAAVLPRPETSLDSFGQDWAVWLERGLVDEAVPMVYRDTPGAVEAMVAAYPAGLPRGKVWVGLRIDRLTPAEVAETARRLAAHGVAGVALFSHVLLESDRAWAR
ncbi:MAG TPA: family 10 glycosylhydrolase [Gemmatimonadota bacterium]|nr:family 10 glycosylhydrolase [Gemmatimonadota bacterium]